VVLTPERLQTLVNRASRLYGVRVAILTPDGKTVVDSNKTKTDSLPVIKTPAVTSSQSLNDIFTFRDSSKKLWYYTLDPINADYSLLVTTPRTVLPLATLIQDNLLAPLLRAAGIALLIALLLAWAMGRWIAAPLQRISEAARAVTQGEVRQIPLQGPSEVQALARSFNEMSQRVVSSQNSQREFVANVSHELKTPLTSIQGFAQAILDGAANTPEALYQSAEVILSEAGRMYRLVIDLLALARLDAGTADLLIGPVDLTGLLTNVAHKFQPIASQAQVTLEAQIPALPAFQGDGDRLAQVFGNLVDNAIKFTPPGGRVYLSASTLPEWVMVQVKDTGIGIDLPDQERIFERFYQADKSRKGGPGRGAGLGLAIARQIVQAQGGSLTVQSALGQGSIFEVRLPLTRPSLVKSSHPNRRPNRTIPPG